MKLLAKIIFSIFFAIAIGTHIYYVFESDTKPFWWHCIYYITYGTCWWMIFSKNKYNSLIYAVMALFPFVTHLYYAYLHFSKLDAEFWICVLVCIILPLGFLWIVKEKTNSTS